MFTEPAYAVAFTGPNGHPGPALTVSRDDLEAVIRVLIFNGCRSFAVELDTGVERTVEMQAVTVP